MAYNGTLWHSLTWIGHSWAVDTVQWLAEWWLAVFGCAGGEAPGRFLHERLLAVHQQGGPGSGYHPEDLPQCGECSQITLYPPSKCFTVTVTEEMFGTTCIWAPHDPPISLCFLPSLSWTAAGSGGVWSPWSEKPAQRKASLNPSSPRLWVSRLVLFFFFLRAFKSFSSISIWETTGFHFSPYEPRGYTPPVCVSRSLSNSFLLWLKCPF